MDYYFIEKGFSIRYEIVNLLIMINKYFISFIVLILFNRLNFFIMFKNI